MKKFMILISLIILTLGIPQIPSVVGETYPSIEVTFQTDPVVVSPGNQGYITLNVNSVGSGTVEGIHVTATVSDYPAIIYEGDWEKSLGDLYSGNSISTLFNFQVSSSTNAGLYEVKFKVTTINAGSVTRYAIIKVEESGVIDIISLTPYSIDVGYKTTLVLTVLNNGQTDIKNILMSWEDEFNNILPIGTDNIIPISSIDAGNTTDIPFDVAVTPSLPAGIYPLFISLEFFDETGSKQIITSEIGIQIEGITDFEVVTQESMGGATTLAIANTGANVASSVIVTIPHQMLYMTSGVSSVNLGNLDAGDYTLATFQISSVELNNTQRPDKSSMTLPSDFSRSDGFRNQSFSGFESNNLIVEVSYTDLFGVRQTVEKEVDFSSFSSSSETSRPSGSKFGGSPPGQSSELDSGTMYIIIGVFGIIVIVTILKIDKVKTCLKIVKGKKK